MIGYIIAGFSLLSLLLGGSTVYYKYQYDDAVKFKDQAEIVAKQAEEYNKLIKHQAELSLKVTNEEHSLEITRLTSDINRLRKQTSSSILPTVSKDSQHPNEVTFDRKELDKAIQEFRDEITELIGEGSYCQIDLTTLNDWLDKQRDIFDKN